MPNVPKKPDDTPIAPTEPTLPTKMVTKQVNHTAYFYDINHHRINHHCLKAGTKIQINPVTVRLTDGTMAYQLDDHSYLVAGNLDGPVRHLKHNAFIYHSNLHCVHRPLLHKGQKLLTYGAPVKLSDGKWHYCIQGSKRAYVKLSKFAN